MVCYFHFIKVGDGDLDHAWWGRPEDMTMARPAYSITTSKPGSDLAGETAAALAAASILFKTSNSGYSASLLTHARQLFTFADKYRGLYSSSIQNAAKFYRLGFF
jgi:endoglucanase